MFNITKGGGSWFVNVAQGDDISMTWEVFDENGDHFIWTGATVTGLIVGAPSNWTINTSLAGYLTVSLSDTQTQAFGKQTFEQYLRVVKAGITSTWLGGELKVRNPAEPVTLEPSSTVIRLDTAGMGTILLRGCPG